MCASKSDIIDFRGVKTSFQICVKWSDETF